MVQIQLEYEGNLRCSAVHGPSQARLSTDAPVDNEGRGESFSPTDLVATALGSCMLTLIGITAKRRGWDLGGVTATVEKKMVADPTRRIGALEVLVRIPGDHPPDVRAALEKTALTCPVHKSLHPDVKIPVRFEWLS